jgi:antitoxin Phd
MKGNKGVILMRSAKETENFPYYNEVLRDIEVGSPVFLTKNGHGRYVYARIR